MMYTLFFYKHVWFVVVVQKVILWTVDRIFSQRSLANTNGSCYHISHSRQPLFMSQINLIVKSHTKKFGDRCKQK